MDPPTRSDPLGEAEGSNSLLFRLFRSIFRGISDIAASFRASGCLGGVFPFPPLPRVPRSSHGLLDSPTHGKNFSELIYLRNYAFDIVEWEPDKNRVALKKHLQYSYESLRSGIPEKHTKPKSCWVGQQVGGQEAWTLSFSSYARRHTSCSLFHAQIAQHLGQALGPFPNVCVGIGGWNISFLMIRDLPGSGNRSVLTPPHQSQQPRTFLFSPPHQGSQCLMNEDMR